MSKFGKFIQSGTGQSLVGGLLGGASSILSGIGAGKRQKREHKHRMELAEYAYAKDLEMWERQWNREIEYNDPSSQMARLRKAGINPHLAYSSGGMSNTASGGTSPGYNAPQIDYDQPLGLEYLGQGIGQGIATRGDLISQKRTKTEVRALRAKADLQEAETHVYKNVTKPEALIAYAQRKYEYEQAITQQSDMTGAGKYGLSVYQVERKRDRTFRRQTEQLNEIAKKVQNATKDNLSLKNVVQRYVNQITVGKDIDPRMAPEYTEMLKQLKKAGIDAPFWTYLLYALGPRAANTMGFK